MKKKIFIILTIITIFIVVIGAGVGVYFNGLKALSTNPKTVEFEVSPGLSKLDIVDKLDEAKLIKSKFSLKIYMFFNRDINLQAGIYSLSPSMSAKEIIKKITNGDVKKEKNTFNLTFIEGRRLTDYAKDIALATNTTTEEVLIVLNDEEYLKELINKYWFLTDEILKEDIYYPLEGYLFASTYEFYNGSTIKDMITKMLDGTAQNLESIKTDVEASSYTFHEMLTMASIVELEGANSDDRKGVAGVFYNRLKIGDSLGSDVTTYYAVQKDFSTDLYQSEINNCNNGYNTRMPCNPGKLPVGPICSPSLASLTAAVKPEEHDFYFFVADKYKKTYFTKSDAEHRAKVAELKNSGLWYEYN